MATKESVAGYSFIRTPKGSYRIDIPAVNLESDDLEALVEQLEKRLDELGVSLLAIKDEIERVGYRALEEVTLRGEALKKYAKDHPVPPEWFDESEDWDDEPE